MNTNKLPKKTLGSFLRERRQSCGYSIRRMIEVMQDTRINGNNVEKISAAYICDIENSRRAPTDRVLNILATILGIDENELQMYDSRVPGQELQDLAQVNAQYGMAFRRMIKHIHDTNIDPQDLLDRVMKNDEKEGIR